MEPRNTMPTPRKDRIRELRQLKGWPQEQLAKVAGLSLKSVQRAEAGRSISFETLQSLASVLDVSVDGLIALPKSEAAAKAVKQPQENPEHKIRRLMRLHTGKSLIDLVGGCGTLLFDHPELKTREEVDLVMEVSEFLHDTLDIWNDVPPSQRVEWAFQLSDKLKTLSGHGLAVFGETHTARYKSANMKEPFSLQSATVVIQRTDHPAIIKVNESIEVLPVAIPTGPVRFG